MIPPGADQRRIRLEIGGDPVVGVIAVDEQKIDWLLAPKSVCDLGHRRRCLRVHPQAAEILPRLGKLRERLELRLGIIEIDRNDLRFRRRELGEQEKRSSVACADLADARRL